jgi:hypothetical protein
VRFFVKRALSCRKKRSTHFRLQLTCIQDLEQCPARLAYFIVGFAYILDKREKKVRSPQKKNVPTEVTSPERITFEVAVATHIVATVGLGPAKYRELLKLIAIPITKQ